MQMKTRLLASLALTALAQWAVAAETTYEQIRSPSPDNWLSVHRTYDAQRFSPLAQIDRTSVRNLQLKYAIGIGGSAANESLEATPLVEDGFMYVVDGWGAVYKIDARSEKYGRVIWKMDPGQQRVGRHRGVALWGNLVISTTGKDGRVIATNKDTGQVVWDKNLHDQPEVELSSAPLALRDRIIVGASGGDQGLRNWVASLEPATGNLQWKTFSVPAPGEPGSETWKDKINAWQTGGGAFYVTGSYDPDNNLTYWGSGNPVPGYDAARRPGDNLYTSSAIAFDAATGRIAWHFQYTPNDNRDYDETGTHIIIDARIDGADRKILSHAGRNGFQYVFDRGNGQFLKATQYVKVVNWTKGIDQKTGKPVDYDPTRDVQIYAEDARANDDKFRRRVCPDVAGGNNYWPATYSRRTRFIYIPSLEGCSDVVPDYSAHVPGKFAGGTTIGVDRITSTIVQMDPATGEKKKVREYNYPNFAGTLSTQGGLVFTALLDGTIAALDDESLDELWKVNVGVGFNAPPMTFTVNGRQYLAIASGLWRNAKNKLARAPEMKHFANQTMVFVFGL